MLNRIKIVKIWLKSWNFWSICDVIHVNEPLVIASNEQQINPLKSKQVKNPTNYLYFLIILRGTPLFNDQKGRFQKSINISDAESNYGAIPKLWRRKRVNPKSEVKIQSFGKTARSCFFMRDRSERSPATQNVAWTRTDLFPHVLYSSNSTKPSSRWNFLHSKIKNEKARK